MHIVQDKIKKTSMANYVTSDTKNLQMLRSLSSDLQSTASDLQSTISRLISLKKKKKEKAQSLDKVFKEGVTVRRSEPREVEKAQTHTSNLRQRVKELEKD